jgi:hypothetical protein
MNLYLIIILAFFIQLITHSQTIINAYGRITNQSGTTFTLNNVNTSHHSFNAGEMVIIMQMQDDVIGTNTTNASTFGSISSIGSAGLWEIRTISGVTVSGTNATITVSTPLTNTYNYGTNSSVQMITFRQLSTGNYTTTSNITGLAWNGSIGGVIAFQVGDNLYLNHNISADGIGFRGGVVSNNTAGGCETNVWRTNSADRGEKGEGIYLRTNANFRYGQAKIINGGGGGIFHNGGGGGGGNFTAGGQGGPGWNGSSSGCSPGAGGQGGVSLSSYIAGNRIFMGGGGGGANMNNGFGTAGERGGGIILIKADTIFTTGSCSPARRISANGLNSANTTGGGNDASGGAGAGGSIILQVNGYSVVAGCSLNIQSNGGNGGTSLFSSTHAGGGGGGQGVIIFSGNQPTLNVSATTLNGNGGCNTNASPCTSSAQPGQGTNNTGIFSNLNNPLPVELLYFFASYDSEISASKINWVTINEINNKKFIIKKSCDGMNFIFLTEKNSQSINGNSTNRLEYHALDMAPCEGENYYMLIQEDLNGIQRVKGITTVLVRSDKKVFFSIFPNPNSGEFFIDFTGISDNTLLQIQLTDLNGKILYDEQVWSNDLKNNHKINPNKNLISCGTYICNIILVKEELNFPVKVLIR